MPPVLQRLGRLPDSRHLGTRTSADNKGSFEFVTGSHECPGHLRGDRHRVDGQMHERDAETFRDFGKIRRHRLRREIAATQLTIDGQVEER